MMNGRRRFSERYGFNNEDDVVGHGALATRVSVQMPLGMWAAVVAAIDHTLKECDDSRVTGEVSVTVQRLNRAKLEIYKMADRAVQA